MSESQRVQKKSSLGLFYELDVPAFSDSISISSTEIPVEILNNNNASFFNISYKISISPMSYSTLGDRNSLFNKSAETVKTTSL